MRDRFPLLLIGGLLLLGSLGWFLVRGAARSDYADVLSTFRASPKGARAVFMLAQELGLPVERSMSDLELPPEQGTFVLLAVEAKDAVPLEVPKAEKSQEPAPTEEDEEDDGRYEGVNYFVPRLTTEEQEALLTHVRAGNTLVYLPWGAKSDPILAAAGFAVRRAEDAVGIRTLVPAQPAPYTLGVERVEARVDAWLDYPQHAVPLLVDPVFGEAVAAVAPVGSGRIVAITAPDLAMNRALGRADNARLWASLLWAVSRGGGPIYFDEYHHGFSDDRSIVHFALRYGLHLALAQLLLGLCFWAAALRRFGRARPPPRDEREGAIDALRATSRLYREGRHHQHAATLIAQGLAQELAPAAGLPARAAPEQVAETLGARGRPELAASLRHVCALAAQVHNDAGVEKVARAAARARTRGVPEARS